MFCRVFFVILVLGVLGSTAQALDGECSTVKSCDVCLNRTDCTWGQCAGIPAVVCYNDSLHTEKNCTHMSCEGTTSIPASTANTTVFTSTAATVTVKPLTTAPTQNGTAANTTTTTTTTTIITTMAPPSPHKNATFDAASFIGGIVLVLGLQAVIFFLYKFCKSKDRNYHTL